MWTNKITSSEIDEFTTEWVNRSFYLQESAWKFSGCLEYLDRLQFPAWANIIFFNDPELEFHIPPILFRGPMLPYPLPVFEQDFNNIEKAFSKIPQQIKTYFLIVQEATETIYDCFKRACQIAQKFNHLQRLQYIVAFRIEEQLKWVVSVFTHQKLFEQQQKLFLALDYRQLTKHSLPKLAPVSQPAGKLLVFETTPHNREVLAQYIQVVLRHKTLPFVLDIIAPILMISDVGDCLLSQIRHYHGTNIIIENGYIQWLDHNTSHTVISFAKSAIKDTEVLAGKLCHEFFSRKAQVLIWDSELIPRPDSPLGLFFQELLDAGYHVWLCLHSEIDNLEMKWQEKISVIRKSGRNGQQLFITKHTTIGVDSRPKQYRCSADAKNEIFGSKYAGLGREIQELSAHGKGEKEIARQLNLSIYTLRQIKRRAGIRVNAPLKRKRRTGMDKKIAALRGSLPVNEIARRLKTSPSYIRKRFMAQDAAKQKLLTQGTEPPTQQFVPYD
ncbi:helix-turn-helix transcriptional regulator [Victivallis sp. Marseille-Q1083]|uniref:helix-turn-helix transcriptional regulator n=1 Tax=Victivallis sp. Marseille-Q1083 TaxID=2717288 RepID=UPI00158C0DA4|nr:helix-turn-helix transcriptional regulator [Victivallis sp. Marseille-Q1083]